MARYLVLLLILWGSLSNNVSAEDNVLLDSINRYPYQDFITSIIIRDITDCDFRVRSNSSKCSQELHNFCKNLTVEDRAAYYDSFGKVGAGILTGNVVYLGYYDQCIDIGNTDFCRFPFNITVSTASPKTINNQLINTTMSFTAPAGAPFEFAMCFPSSCTAEEFYHLFFGADDIVYSQTFTDNGTDNVTTYYTINVTVPVTHNEPMCPWKDLKWTPSSIIMLTICILFVVLVIIGTLADVLMWFISDILPTVNVEMKAPATLIDSTSCSVKDSVDEAEPLINTKARMQVKRGFATTRWGVFLKDLILAFSLYKTMPAIMSTHQPPNAITSINGIRVISMFWVILGHTYLWGLDYGVTANVEEAVATVPERFFFQPVNNAFLSVDTFFVLSGLLLSYLSIREMERRKGKFPFAFFYIHRVLRLSPAYYFAVFFSFKVLPYIGSGPLWHLPDVARCEKYWWTNILYINNFYPTTFADQCYGVTWYLANDMQFFIVSPIFLILLYRFWKIGLATIVGTMLASIAVIGILAGIKNPNANLLIGQLSDNGEGATSLGDFAFSNIYEKPYCRINAYLVGIVLGFVFYKKFRVKPNFWMHTWFYTGLWVVATVLSATIAFGQYKTWNDHPFTKTENVMYFMFSRTVFSIGIALMIYACHNGFGGIINSFLSWSFWVPPSRLTFMAYLSHPMILTLMYSTMRFRFIYTDYFLIVLVVSAVVLSYGLALVLAVTVEYPLANVEAAVYKLAGLKRRK